MSIKKAGTTGTRFPRIALSTIALALAACGSTNGDDVTADDDVEVDAGPTPDTAPTPDAPTACVADPNDPCKCNRPWMDSPETKQFVCEITNTSAVSSATCDPELIANKGACTVRCDRMFWAAGPGLSIDATAHTFSYNDGTTQFNCHE